MEYIELNNWIKMPMLGLGTYLVTPDEAENSVEVALKNGYKLIDTANAYAQKYNKSNAQIILRWHIQMGYIVKPGARSENHIKENINIFDFKLTNEEMAEISKLNKNEPFYVRTDEALKRFASWVPDVENQK